MNAKNLRRRIRRDKAVIACLLLALGFAILWGRSEYKRGDAERATYERTLRLIEYQADYKALQDMLANRGRLEAFIELQNKSYSSLIHARGVRYGVHRVSKGEKE